MYIRLYKSFIIVIVIVIVIIIIIIPDRWSKNKHINSRSKSVVWRATSRSLARLQITLFQIPSEEIEMINDQETH
jgi:competence protein ComGC